MSDSTWDDPNVTAYILGELSKDEVDAFEQRLRNDPQLAEVVAEARDVFPDTVVADDLDVARVTKDKPVHFSSLHKR